MGSAVFELVLYFTGVHIDVGLASSLTSRRHQRQILETGTRERTFGSPKQKEIGCQEVSMSCSVGGKITAGTRVEHNTLPQHDLGRLRREQSSFGVFMIAT